MTSSSKKKKQKKKDFQKVKLKVGKKIPKGNVVDTTFKAKKIIIKEQLQQREDQPDSIRVKNDIKENVSKLKHYSTSVRMDAMKNLKESLTVFPELIQLNLHSLVEKLSDTITDTFTPLRKLNITVLKLIFSKIQSEQIIPFFPIMVAHLRCAMTHLEHEIQRDSLGIVDLLLDFFPNHLKYYSKYLLSDFLNQISNQTKSFTRTASHQKSKRLLSSDPSRKVTSLSWYLKVSQRLQNILRTILGNGDTGDQINEEASKCVAWNSERPFFLPIYNNQFITVDYSACRDNPRDFFEDTKQLKEVTSSLMPLLFQIWVEAASLNDASAKNLVSGEAMEVYQCIVEIIHLLWKIISNWQVSERDFTLHDWFVHQFGNSFIKHCMAWFPYTDNCKSWKKINGEQTNRSQNAARLNLILCDMLTHVALASKGEEKKQISIAKNYIIDTLNNCDGTLAHRNVEVIVEIVKRILEKDSWQANQKLLESTREAAQTFSIESKGYISFLHLLCDIVQQSKYTHLFKIAALSSWLAQLPEDLVRANAIPWKLIDIIRLVAPRCQAEFLANLQLYLPSAFEKLSGLCVSDGDMREAQRVIVDMLYWIPNIDTSLLSLIAKLCISQEIDICLSSYIIQVLNSRYQRCDPSAWSDGPVAYISFLISISLGCSRMELQELNRNETSHHSNTMDIDAGKKFFISQDSSDRLVHQKNLTLAALKALLVISSDSMLRCHLEGFLIQVLNEHKILPLRSVHSLFVLVSRVWNGINVPKSLCASLLMLSLLYLEILAAGDEFLQNLSVPVVTEFMKLAVLNDLICDELLKIASGKLSSTPIELFGNILIILAKSCQQKHAEILWRTLNHVQDGNKGSIETSPWFVGAKYELLCKNENLGNK